MKKILVFGLSSYYGGIESFFLNYLYFKNVDNLKFDFIPENNELARNDEFKKLNCYIYSICNWRRHPFKYINQLNDIFSSNNYNAIYLNCLSAYNILPLVIAKKRGINIRIVHSHNSSAPKNYVKFLIHYFNRAKLNKLSNYKFACSDQAGQWMFGNNKFKVIPNAIDARKFKFSEANREYQRKKWNIQNDYLVLGYVGRLAYQKNPLFLIEILYQLLKIDERYILVIVGDGELKEEVKNKINRLNLQKNVMLLGNRNDISDLLHLFDIFLLPSKFEGLGIVLIEAQFSGLKCIVSDNVPSEANISNSIVYLPISKSSKMWVKEILDLKNKLPNRNALSQKCNTIYDLNYSSKDFFNLLNSIIKEDDIV